MVRGVVGDCAEDGHARRTAHDRSRRDRGHQLSIALGGQRRLRGSDSLVEPGARGAERRVALHDFGVRVEVGVESFRSERPFDKPTDGVCGVGHLLRGGHHAQRGPHAGVFLRQAPCGAVEELLRAIELGQGLLCEWHGRSSDAERRDLRTTAATRQCGVGAQPFGGDEAAVGSLATVTAAGARSRHAIKGPSAVQDEVSRGALVSVRAGLGPARGRDAVALCRRHGRVLRSGGDGRCCMKNHCGWGGVACTSRDPPQEPHYRDAVEGSSHV